MGLGLTQAALVIVALIIAFLIAKKHGRKTVEDGAKEGYKLWYGLKKIPDRAKEELQDEYKKFEKGLAK